MVHQCVSSQISCLAVGFDGIFAGKICCQVFILSRECWAFFTLRVYRISMIPVVSGCNATQNLHAFSSPSYANANNFSPLKFLDIFNSCNFLIYLLHISVLLSILTSLYPSIHPFLPHNRENVYNESNETSSSCCSKNCR